MEEETHDTKGEKNLKILVFFGNNRVLRTQRLWWLWQKLNKALQQVIVVFK